MNLFRTKKSGIPVNPEILSVRGGPGFRNSKLESTVVKNLDKLEDYYRSIRPWLLPRQEDSTLIVPPNQVFKLAGSAFPLFAWLDGGGHLHDLPLMTEEKSADLETFFAELKTACGGNAPQLAQGGHSGHNTRNDARKVKSASGFGRIPYDFSFTGLPILGELALTYRCNERCRFCYASCGESPTQNPTTSASAMRKELTTEEAKRIISIFKHEAKIPFFSFTGGEPLLRPDLEELAKYACSLGLRINLITNGSLASPERARALHNSGIDTAQVSLESPDSTIHDLLCGCEGAWKRTVSGIASLKAAGIAVQTNSTLTALNRESLSGMPEFLAGLGVGRFSMNLFIPSGRGIADSELLVRYSDTGGFVEGIRKKARAAGLTFFWYSPTPYCIYNPVARGLGNKSCAAMDGLIHINPFGDVLPCSSWPESIGDILAVPFRDIWFSERARFFKQKHFAPSICKDCESFVACQGACPLYFKVIGESEIQKARGGIHGE